MTQHRIPWGSLAQLPGFGADVWELNGPDDWTRAHDVSREQPDKFRELRRVFLIEAAEYNVLPLDDRRIERLVSHFGGPLATDPWQISAAVQRNGTDERELRCCAEQKAHAETAHVRVADAAARGVIIHQGTFEIWSVYARDGRRTYCHDLFARSRFKIEGDAPPPAGEH